MRKNSKNMMVEYFNGASKPLIINNLWGILFVDLILGCGFGTITFGIQGTIVYFSLMLLHIIVLIEGKKQISNNNPKLVFLLSSIFSMILCLLLLNMGYLILVAIKDPNININSLKLYPEFMYLVLVMIIQIIIYLVFIKQKDIVRCDMFKVFKKINKLYIVPISTSGILGITLAKAFGTNNIFLIFVFILILIIVNLLLYIPALYLHIYYMIIKGEIDVEHTII